MACCFSNTHLQAGSSFWHIAGQVSSICQPCPHAPHLLQFPAAPSCLYTTLALGVVAAVDALASEQMPLQPSSGPLPGELWKV